MVRTLPVLDLKWARVGLYFVRFSWYHTCMCVLLHVCTCVCTYMCTYFAQMTSDILTALNGQLLCATNAMALGPLGVPVFFSGLYYSHRPVVLYVCFSPRLAPAQSGNRDM